MTPVPPGKDYWTVITGILFCSCIHAFSACWALQSLSLSVWEHYSCLKLKTNHYRHAEKAGIPLVPWCDSIIQNGELKADKAPPERWTCGVAVWEGEVRSSCLYLLWLIVWVVMWPNLFSTNNILQHDNDIFISRQSILISSTFSLCKLSYEQFVSGLSTVINSWVKCVT